MHQSTVVLHTHDFDHGLGSKGIYKTGCRLPWRSALVHHQALGYLHGAVLRITGAAKKTHGLAKQSLRRLAAASLYHHTPAFISDRHGFTKSCLQGR